MGEAAPAFEIHISQNGYARGWYWEIMGIADHEIVARGLAATHAAAQEQAGDAIASRQGSPSEAR
jgi:hypothetical protein